jgi:hypothetical protein
MNILEPLVIRGVEYTERFKREIGQQQIMEVRSLVGGQFIRFAHISYGRFIAIHYKFKCSVHILELFLIEGVVYRERDLNEKMVRSR